MKLGWLTAADKSSLEVPDGGDDRQMIEGHQQSSAAGNEKTNSE